jgi:hypothetical protein
MKANFNKNGIELVFDSEEEKQYLLKEIAEYLDEERNIVYNIVYNYYDFMAYVRISFCLEESNTILFYNQEYSFNDDSEHTQQEYDNSNKVILMTIYNMIQSMG